VRRYSVANKIWHPDDLNSAQWFIAGSKIRGLDWIPNVTPKPGSPEFLNLPESMKRILRLDNPDLIATIERRGVDVPVVSIEITTTTPQSQHAKQRVPRLVAAAEADVPSVYIIPGRKKSGGSTYSLTRDLYYGIDMIRLINTVPVFIYTYPDKNGSLLRDINYPNQPDLKHPETITAFQTIDKIMEYRLDDKQIQDLNSDPWISQEIKRQSDLGTSAAVAIENYDTLTQIETCELKAFLEKNTRIRPNIIRQTLSRLPRRITNRDKTLIFRPRGRMFAHAGDPYCGMLAFFDYAFCRTGRSVENRKMNLVYMPAGKSVSFITREFCRAGYYKYWSKDCPFRNDDVPSIDDQFTISHHLQYGCVFTKIKPLRIYGYFSDMIIFRDAILVF